MLRTSVVKFARPALLSRTFATTSRAMSAGDTGAPPKTGGQGYVSEVLFSYFQGIDSILGGGEIGNAAS